MSTMTKDPMRTTQKKDAIISAGPKSYARLVTAPATRYFSLIALGWCGSLNSILALIAWLLAVKGYTITPEGMMYPVAFCTLLGLSIAGFTGADKLMTLHSEYLSTPDRTTTVTRNEHGILSDGRGVQVNGVPNAIVVRRDPKVLHGVTFQSLWLERMDALIADEDYKFTRDKIGISGSKFAECRGALARAGFINEQSEYTEEGLLWIQQK